MNSIMQQHISMSKGYYKIATQKSPIKIS